MWGGESGRPARHDVPDAIPPQSRMTRVQAGAHTLLAAGLLAQAATGFGSKLIYGALGGWALLAHMAGGGLFLIGLTASAVLWAERCRFGPGGTQSGLTPGRRAMFWVTITLGLVVAATAVGAMTSLFTPEQQHMLIELHGKAALALLVTMVPHTIVSWRARRDGDKSG